jgi:hypothetical protein
MAILCSVAQKAASAAQHLKLLSCIGDRAKQFFSAVDLSPTAFYIF